MCRTSALGGFDSCPDEDEYAAPEQKTESELVAEDTKAAVIEFKRVFKNWLMLVVPWRRLLPEENLPEGELVSYLLSLSYLHF